MFRQILLLASEVEIQRAADASPRWTRAESASFWQRWVFDSCPPVGLYLGRGNGPSRSEDRERKVDTWPTPFAAAQEDIDAALAAAVASLPV